MAEEENLLANKEETEPKKAIEETKPEDEKPKEYNIKIEEPKEEKPKEDKETNVDENKDKTEDKNDEEKPKESDKEEKRDQDKATEDEKAKDDDKNDDKKDEKEEEEEKKFEIRNDLLPDDYVPKQRPSIAQTTTVPAYPKDARRLSKLEMDQMKSQIDKMTEAMINDPEAASRRYSTAPNPIMEDDEKYLKDRTQNKLQKATTSDPTKLTVKTVLLGIAPCLGILVIAILAIIVYAIASGEKSISSQPGAYGDWPNWGGLSNIVSFFVRYYRINDI